MINAFVATPILVEAGDRVPFAGHRAKTRNSCYCNGGWLTHEDGSGQFLIARAGVVAAYKHKKASVDYPLDRYATLELTKEKDSFVRQYTTRTYSPRSSSSGGGSRHGGGGGHRGGR